MVADLRVQTNKPLSHALCAVTLSSDSCCISLFFSISGFSFDRDHQLYFDDTCVVPERLEGETRKTNKIENKQNARFCLANHLTAHGA